MENLSQDIVSFLAQLVDYLRTEWTVIDIDETNPAAPIIRHEVLQNYTIEGQLEIELGYWNFTKGDGFNWVTILKNSPYDETEKTFKMNNVDEVDLSLVTTARNTTPYFYHGTPIDVNKELDTSKEIFSDAIYPAVILWEVIRQDFTSAHTSLVGNTPRLIISFLDTTNKLDWTQDEQYKNVVDPMELLANKFIKICDNHNYIAKLENYTYIKSTNWGKVVQDRGHIKYILDENLAGLNLEIDLPIKKNCLNKYAKI